ncbi:MAG: ribosome maturation factor RimM [Oscillospiraceae bacterium]|nr:ribosome maturation factor RimM [Oscillospiraceae bacterium]
MGEYIKAGKITSAHSFSGEAKIQSWCDTPEFLLRFKVFYLDENGQKPLVVEKIRTAGNFLVASFEGIQTVEDISKLKNKILYAKKQDADLEEGTYFISDMTGLPVFDFETGEKYGILSDIFDNGAHDIYVVTTEVIEKNNKNREIMIPNVPAFVKKVDLAEGVFVTLIEGML